MSPRSRPPGLPGRAQIVPQPPAAYPLQYSNGNTLIKRPGDARFTKGPVGFHCEAGGRNPAFDRFARKYALPTLEVKHERQGGSEIKPHWDLGETISFIPLTRGPVAPTVSASKATPHLLAQTAEAGIGLVWPDSPRTQPGHPRSIKPAKSKLAVRGYLVLRVQDELRVFPQVVQLTTTGRMTDKLMAALRLHALVAEAADLHWNRPPDDPVGCYELRLPLRVGPEEEWQGGQGGQSTVCPFVADHPQVDLLLAAGKLLHEDEISKRQALLKQAVTPAYLATVKLNDQILDLVVRDWPQVLLWARQFCFGSIEPSTQDFHDE
ncbi:MAG TPA: hypothetical protein VFZ66_27570 [Herpetosiphonaceae bacterium]